LDLSNNRAAIAGRLTANGAGTFTSGVADVNESGMFTTLNIFAASYFITDSTSGRGILNLPPLLGGVPQNLNFVVYMVNSGKLFAMETDAVVSVSGLTRSFNLSSGTIAFEGWRPVIKPVRITPVDDIALEVMAGEVLGLVGESGSGKTTLGRAILRLIEPDSGTIRIAGQTVSGRPQSALEDMRRAAQIVFQNPDSSLNPRKTIRELLGRPIERFGLAPSGEIPARVNALLDLVRLPAHYADRYAHQMSGGEKQRVGIARALATEPRFIVCDEPVSALDVSVQAAIVNLLADLRDRLGVAYLFISHDISVVAHLSDRIAVMHHGKIVEIGPAEQLMRSPQHAYTAKLLAAVPRVDGPAVRQAAAIIAS